jgi:hypothetical protein
MLSRLLAADLCRSWRTFATTAPAPLCGRGWLEDDDDVDGSTSEETETVGGGINMDSDASVQEEAYESVLWCEPYGCGGIVEKSYG